jgi:transposase
VAGGGGSGSGVRGIAFVAAVTKVADVTIRDGIKELDGQEPGNGRIRRPGGGRKRAEQLDPELPAALDALVEPVTRGDPESPLRWTSKSLNTLAGELTAQGHPVSDDTVRRLLMEAGFSLQANAKTIEGKLVAREHRIRAWARSRGMRVPDGPVPPHLIGLYEGCHSEPRRLWFQLDRTEK